ncbi:nuclear receptor subfamily 0 group B member 1-like, partial [Saccoglossus kowalevskii]
MDCKRLQCQGCIPSRQNERSILYNLLAAPPSSVTMETDGTFIQTAENSSSRVSTHHHYCHHYLQHTKALLKYPDIVQQEAAQLLLKTIDFTKNLPIYWDLDHNDRVQLYLHGWAEMLVLTMAQYKFDFEITEQSYESHEQSTPHAAQDRVKFDTSQQGIPVWGDVKKINNFLQRCHHLQIDDKEYAYLKSTILFNA